MAVYAITGKLGTGKTKFAVWMVQQALRAGRKVAGNVDVKCEVLHPFGPRSYMRIPDKPSAFDLDSIGHGNPDSYDESKNGVLVLDELGTWLNARSWQDPGRAAALDWFIHARKKGWDLLLIVQDANLIDKQARDALIEYEARCMRMDKVRIPVVGHLLGLFRDRWAYWPKFHTVTARLGYDEKVIAERWIYRGDDLHDAYDTRQVFSSRYEHGPHSTLPPWDWKPADLPWAAFRKRLVAAFRSPLPKLPEARRRVDCKPKLPHVARLMTLPPAVRIEALRRMSHAAG